MYAKVVFEHMLTDRGGTCSLQYSATHTQESTVWAVFDMPFTLEFD